MPYIVCINQLQEPVNSLQTGFLSDLVPYCLQYRLLAKNISRRREQVTYAVIGGKRDKSDQGQQILKLLIISYNIGPIKQIFSA